MTDEKRDRTLELIRRRRESNKFNVRGLGAWAQRIETGIRQGLYEDGDAPALAELINVVMWTLQRVSVFIDDERLDENDEERETSP